MSGAGGAKWALALLLLAAAPSGAAAERLPITRYDSADGLASTWITHIRRDSRGLLWLSTRDGLSRFDGSQFVNYGREHGLPPAHINYVLESRRGDYWLASNGEGVIRLSASARWGPPSGAGSLVRVYPTGPGSVGSSRVNVLLEDRAGNLWSGTDAGLFQLDPRRSNGAFRKVEFQGCPQTAGERVVSAIVEDRNGHLWIGTNDCGVTRRYPDGRQFHYLFRPLGSQNASIQALLEDAAGRLWIGTNQGLLIMRPEPDVGRGSAGAPGSRVVPVGSSESGSVSDETVRLPTMPGQTYWYSLATPAREIGERSIFTSSDGHVWIGTNAGLFEFDGVRFRNYTARHGLASDQVRALAEDLEGNMWIGTSGAGVMKLTRGGFTSYQPDSLGGEHVRSIAESREGAIYAVSGRWALSRIDDDGVHAVEPNVPEGAQAHWTSRGAFRDRRERWWLLTTSGLGRLPQVAEFEELDGRALDKLYVRGDGLTGSPISMFEDHRGELWVGALSRDGSGLFRWDEASQRFHVELDWPDPNRWPSSFAEDRSGQLWVASYTGGLWRRRAGRFAEVPAAAYGSLTLLSALYADRAGRIWLGSHRDGLVRIDQPTAAAFHVARYTIADGLSSNNIRCLTEDRWGRLYLCTPRGVDRLEPESGRVRHYSTQDGLASDFVTAGYCDRRGRLWFGTYNGLSMFVPEKERPSRPPPVWISGVRIAGVAQEVAHLGQTEIAARELGSDQNQLDVEFFGIGFAMGETVRYQYRLFGADSAWSSATSARVVHYARLSPGDYRFEVRAVVPTGQTSPHPARFAFTILPPIWGRWWFLASSASALALLLYAAHRARMARLVALEKVRTRIASDLHDDIGSNLSQIAILSEVARKHAAGGTGAETADALDRIGSLSRESVDSMGDIVWAIDPRQDRLPHLAHRMRRLASELLSACGIELEFRADEAPAPSLGPDIRRDVFLIFKETLHNIVRHSRATRVVVELGHRGRDLVLRVEDDGVGFDAERREPLGRGQGLDSMMRRAAGLGGRLTVAAGVGAGTRISLAVRVN